MAEKPEIMTVKVNNKKKNWYPLVVTRTWCLVGTSIENNLIEPTASTKLSVGFTFYSVLQGS